MIPREWAARAAAMLVLTAAAAAVTVSGPASSAQSKSSDSPASVTPRRFSKFFVDATKKVRPAVVSIDVVKRIEQTVVDPFGGLFGPRRPRTQTFEQRGFGSGVIVTPDGYVLTNNHVAGGAAEIVVKLIDGRRLKGQVVGSDPLTDLAVVKVPGEGLPSAPLGSSADLEVGEWVIAIGSPFQLDSTVTAGIVSATGRANVGLSQYEDFIQTDAAINPGNSGGPLINLEGEIVGVNSAILGGVQRANLGIGFAIPIDMAKFVMKQIIDNGRVVRGYLGIDPENLTPEVAGRFSVKEGSGILVSRVGDRTPAAEAGLKSNDVILSFNGQAVADSDKFRLLVAETQPGSRVPIEYVRDGERLRATVEIVPRPDLVAAIQVEIGRLGLVAVDLEASLARDLRIDESSGGAVVVSVASRGVAASAGLRRGDVILEVGRRPISGAAELESLLGRYRSGATTVLLVVRGDESSYVTIRLP